MGPSEGHTMVIVLGWMDVLQLYSYLIYCLVIICVLCVNHVKFSDFLVKYFLSGRICCQVM